MSTTDLLLLLILLATVGRIYQAHAHRTQNAELFSAGMTMMGEWFEMWRDRDG